MLGNLKTAFIFWDSVATRIFMKLGPMFYTIPSDIDVKEFWAIPDDRSVPKPEDIFQAETMKKRIMVNRFRFEMISHFGRWMCLLTIITIMALSVLIGVGTFIKHLF